MDFNWLVHYMRKVQKAMYLSQKYSSFLLLLKLTADLRNEKNH